jgi:hypothetical protein
MKTFTNVALCILLIGGALQTNSQVVPAWKWSMTSGGTGRDEKVSRFV